MGGVGVAPILCSVRCSRGSLKMCCFSVHLDKDTSTQGTAFRNNPGCQEPCSFSRPIKLWCVCHGEGSGLESSICCQFIPPVPWLSNSATLRNHPEGLLKQTAGSLWISDSRWTPRICMSNKCPGDTDAASWGPGVEHH